MTDKIEGIDPHFYHSVGLGISALLFVKYMERGTEVLPPAQIVQLYSKPPNKQLIVGIGVVGVAYYWMKTYGHSLGPLVSTSSPPSL
jgi:hypothetical protein